MVNTLQPSLAISKFIAIDGVYPSSGGGSGLETIGMIRMFGGNFDPGNDRLVQGQLLSVTQSSALFTLIGTAYGGDGQTTFALPNEAGRPSTGIGQGPGLANRTLGEEFGASTVALTQANLTPSSGGAFMPFQNQQPTLATQYLIRLSGAYQGGPGTTPTAEIVEFAGSMVPGGYAACNGQLLSIAQYPTLFALLGTTYGGNGQTTFALPDLRGSIPVGAGTLDGQTVALGQRVGSASTALQQSQMPAGYGGSGASVDNRQPSLGLTYLIATSGIFPSRDNGSAPEDQHYLGEIILYAGNPAPMTEGGWAPTDGRLLSISQNTALFALLGTAYGGDGRTTFGLPDLRGRTAVGQGVFEGVSQNIGAQMGAGAYTLAPAEIPALVVNGSAGPDVFYGGTFADRISGAEGADLLYGNPGRDTLSGGPGADVLYGNQDDDVLYGNQDNDVLYGGQGNDVAYGGQGDDLLWGNLGDDALYGNLGADTLAGGAGVNVLDGGDGPDTASYADAVSGVTVSLLLQGSAQATGASTDTLVSIETLIGSNFNDALTGDAGSNVLSGGPGADTLSGGAGADVLYGNQDNDVLYGNQDNDVLYGGQGNDVLYGGQGDDLIVGGVGADILYGNLGADTFLYATAADSPPGGGDVIADFVSGTDRIDLRATRTGGADRFDLSTVGGVTTLEVDLGSDGTVDLRVTILGTAVAGDVIWT